MNKSFFSACVVVASLSSAAVCYAAPGKADIAITDMKVNSNCYIVVSLKNVGTTQLPLSADDPMYGTAIQFYSGNNPAGGYKFPSGLRQPGSTTDSVSDFPQINGTVTITAEFKPNGSYEDINQANNKMTKTFTCTPPVVPKPDLTVTSVDFTDDCRPRIRLANIGTASMPAYQFSAVALQRVIDNLRTGTIYLKTVDSTGKLMSPQSTAEWIDGKEYMPQSTISYYLTTTNNTVLNDANHQNNTAMATLPDRCKIAQTATNKADIAITDMKVNSDCYIVVSLKNVGTTQLPLSADDPMYGTGIQFYSGNNPAGGYKFPSGLRQPGSTTDSVSGFPQINGTTTMTAEFKTNGSYEDIIPANNRMTKTFTCTPPVVPKPDLTVTSVDFTDDCRPRIRLANIGAASMPAYQFSSVALQRVVDNMRTGIIYIRTVDSTGRLMSPQGTAEWIDGKEYMPQSTISYYLTTTNSTVLNDANHQNNTAIATLPNRCKTAKPPVIRKLQPQPLLPATYPKKQPISPLK